MEPKYTYRCKLCRVIDGDTIVVDLDLGFGVWLHNQYLRLYGINTPEIRGEERPAGLAARRFVIDALAEDAAGDVPGIVIDTIKSSNKGKFGRWLAIVWYSHGVNWTNLNDELVNTGHAEVREY